MSDNALFDSLVNIPDSQIIHDLAILKLQRSECFPLTDLELIRQYTENVSSLVEAANEYRRLRD